MSAAWPTLFAAGVGNPTERQVLVFLVQIFVLLVAARLGGQAARRAGLPSVVGEIVAGIALGPTVAGRLAPDVWDWVFQQSTTVSSMVYAVGWLGVVMLLCVTGFETDLGLIRKLGRPAAWVTVGSLAVPFAAGLAVGYSLPDSLIGADTERSVFAAFIAVALAISALPVIAKVLSEMGLLRRNFGQLTLAVGMTNDVAGWIALGVISGVAADGGFDAGRLTASLGFLAAFLAVAGLVGQRLVDSLLFAMRRSGTGPAGWITVIVVTAVGIGAVTQALGVEAVLGAFIAGILIGRSRYTDVAAQHNVEMFTGAFLAPIFFATAGLRVDLGTLFDWATFGWAVLVLAVASAAKFAGAWVGARVSGLSSREGAALGAGLNARGALEIVVASVGLSLDVLNATSYTVIVVMAVVTSVAAAPMLRLVVRNWAGTDEEAERMRTEQRLAGNSVLRGGRALVVTTGGPAGAYAAAVVDAFLPAQSAVTLADRGGDDGDALRLAGPAAALASRDLDSVAVGDPERLVQRAGFGYQLTVTHLAAGATELDDAATAALLEIGHPAVLLRPAAGLSLDDRPGRVLLPLAGSAVGRAAREVALAYAAAAGAHVDLLRVDAPTDGHPAEPGDLDETWLSSLVDFASDVARVATHVPFRSHSADRVGRELVEDAVSAAHDVGVYPHRLFTESASVAAAIVAAAEHRASDLIVVGAEPRAVSDGVHLGPIATTLLAKPDLSVAVVAVRPR